MTYEAMLREMFQGVDLEIEDIYLLEGFQIAYLPDRVPPCTLLTAFCTPSHYPVNSQTSSSPQTPLGGNWKMY